MAISFIQSSIFVSGTGNITPAIPTGSIAGDIMFCLIGTKPFNGVNTMPSGWVSLGSFADGTVPAGTGTGSMKTEFFYKVHTGTESNPTITNPTNNVSGATILTFRSDTASSWDFSAGGGGDTTADVSFSITTTNIDLAPDDWAVLAMTLRDDGAFTGGTNGQILTSAPGITFNFSQATQAPVVWLSTTDGGDMGMKTGYIRVTSGSGSVPVTFSNILATAETGSGYFVRFREVVGGGGTSVDPFGMMGFFGI